MTFGQNVKKLRKKYGLSLKALAESSNISFSMLSKIERDEKNPTLNVAARIARALKTSVSDLVEERFDNNVVVVRKNQRKYYRGPDMGMSIEHISSLIPPSNIEILFINLMPGVSTGVLPSHREGVKEYIFVKNGAIRLSIDSMEYDLDEGDYIYYEPNRPHQLSNINTDDESSVYLIVDRSGFTAN